jgi:hypothetical protein
MNLPDIFYHIGAHMAMRVARAPRAVRWRARVRKGSTMAETERLEAAGDVSVGERKLTPEARRALAEAEARRREADARPPMPEEFNGPSGPEPVRYGDWERKGIASDF